MNKNLNEINNLDDVNNEIEKLSSGLVYNLKSLTKFLLPFAFSLILFSFFAPYLFSKIQTEISFDSNSGVIGDTIGGIMNPFISISGVILTFLAFYIQIKANENQLRLLQLQLRAEKLVETEREKILLEKKFSLFILDLKILYEDLNTKIELIREFNTSLKGENLDFVFLPKTHLNNKFNDIYSFERQEIFNCYNLFFSDINENWLNEFSKLYRNLEIFKNYIEGAYLLSENFYEKFFSLKKEYKREIDSLLDICVNYIRDNTNNRYGYIKSNVELCNNVIERYYEIIGEDNKKFQSEIDNVENKNQRNFIETDIILIDGEIVEKIILKESEIRELTPNNDLKDLIKTCSKLRKLIGQMSYLRKNLLIEITEILNQFSGEKNVITDLEREIKRIENFKSK